MNTSFYRFVHTLVKAVVLICLLPSGGTCLNLYEYLEQNNITSTAECQEQKSAFLQGVVDGDAWALQSNDPFVINQLDLINFF